MNEATSQFAKLHQNQPQTPLATIDACQIYCGMYEFEFEKWSSLQTQVTYTIQYITIFLDTVSP